MTTGLNRFRAWARTQRCGKRQGAGDYAVRARAHAINFQIVDVDRLVADRKQLFRYEVLVDRATGATETVEEPLYHILKRRALTKERWRGSRRTGR